jgi:hypothetical protein
MSQITYAVTIAPNTVIDTSTSYTNTSLDMTNGNFIVKKGATLTIENCNITGTISPNNPNLIAVQLGSLNLSNNQINITATMIPPTPTVEASFYAMRLERASANLTGNTISVDQQYSVGLLTSSVILPSKNIVISGNTINNFHGVFYLLNATNSIMENNTLKMNSAGHFVIVGSQAQIKNNSIYFAGLNQLGDAVDVINSDDVTISGNTIYTPTSEGIGIALSDNVVIDNNVITGGNAYGIYIYSNNELRNGKNSIGQIYHKLDKKLLKFAMTSHITISNNFLSQNRYAIAGSNINTLSATGNYFSQRFPTATARQFWTDNNILLKNVTSLTWTNNFYKEAFTQVNGEDNGNVDFIPFPESGGVVLPA